MHRQSTACVSETVRIGRAAHIKCAAVIRLADEADALGNLHHRALLHGHIAQES